MRSLELSFCFALLTASTTSAAFLDADSGSALLVNRQAPGTPQFACHENCGNALAGGRNPAHCDNSTWIGLYEACLDCALDFDIWKIYGNGVGGAASACGLSATPSPSDDDAKTGTVPSSTSTSGPSETSVTTGVASTTTTEVAESGGGDGPATTEAPSVTESGEGGFGSTTTATTSISTAGALRSEVHILSSLLSVGAAAVVFGGMMGAW